MSDEPAPVVDCTKCGAELTARTAPLCNPCVEVRVDNALEQQTVGCNHCDNDAEVCEDCGNFGRTEAIREYADRRKMLGLMPPEIYRAFEECIEELR